MNRRTYVHSTVVGSLALASARITSGKESADTSSLNITSPPAFELDEMTIGELQAGMASRKYSAHLLGRKYFDRIEAIDKRGPAINSVIELNPDALSVAPELHKAEKAGPARGPFHR